MLLPLVLLAFVAQSPLRDPAFAPDGRLAVSIDGDLWVQEAPGRDASWQRLTSGPAWDREPAWTSDGAAIVFTSDREGNLDLWRVAVPRAGAPARSAAPERLTRDPADDMEPSVAPDGSIIFTRGRDATARLWRRDPNGDERRLTTGTAPERWGRVSPDGRAVAYVQSVGSAPRLRVRSMAGDTADSVVTADRAPERPAWSPDGRLLLFASASPSPGVYVTPRDGRYVNLVSATRGAVAWSPDGALLAVAAVEGESGGYNGDPRRLPDRIAESLGSVLPLVWIAAPRAPDEDVAVVAPPSPVDRTARNAEMFDRVWSRIDRLYFAAAEARSRRVEWERMRDAHRPRALAAPDDEALARVLHALLQARPAYRDEAAGQSAVSSAHPVATDAGLEILRRGGNVVDAAVAVSFALGVVEPDASGIGGYGQMLVHLAGMERPVLFEFMARVPEEASLANGTLLEGGRYPDDGPILAIAPGTVAGMAAAWKRFGSGAVPWSDLLAPAIRAARDGFVVSDGLATTLDLERARFLKYDGSRALFFRNGAPLRAGDTLRNPDLAWTLERIVRDGADGFYKGDVARRLVQDLRGHGNAIRMTDLARYYAPEREPVHFTYRGHDVYSSAPPVQGGALLAAQLGNLEQVATPRPYTDDAATLHAMIAAWQLAPTARGRIADPGLWPVTTEPFTSKDTARVRWRCFDPARAVTPALFRGDTLRCDAARVTPAPPPPPGRESGVQEGDVSLASNASRPRHTTTDAGGAPDDRHAPGAPHDDCADLYHADGSSCRPQGTTAFAVGDAAGNLVAVTQTLGTWGGNFHVTPGLGFLYNDKLTSYGTDPGSYGARLSSARHGSTLAPTIAFRGSGAAKEPWFAIGAAGNAWITSAVYQGVVGMMDFGLSPQRALELPRFLPRQRGAANRREMVIDVEDGLSPDVVAALRGMGYHLERISLLGELRMGYGAAVQIDGSRVRAGGDPRRSGAAGAVPPS